MEDVHVALVQPEIPWNTGNTGRTCLAFGARLHLVEPLGFSLDAKEVRRAGLDYWPDVALTVHASFEALARRLDDWAQVWFLSTDGCRTLDEVPLAAPTLFLLGSETRGLPPALRERYRDRLVRIPQSDGVRSLNLSTAAALALYEFRRRTLGSAPCSNPNPRTARR